MHISSPYPVCKCCGTNDFLSLSIEHVSDKSLPLNWVAVGVGHCPCWTAVCSGSLFSACSGSDVVGPNLLQQGVLAGHRVRLSYSLAHQVNSFYPPTHVIVFLV